MRPIAPWFLSSLNHRAPSSPAAIDSGPAFPARLPWYSVIVCAEASAGVAAQTTAARADARPGTRIRPASVSFKQDSRALDGWAWARILRTRDAGRGAQA